MKKIIGYDYETKKLVVNEKESVIIKIIFDLRLTYNLIEDEIYKLITKELTLDQVINFRINKIKDDLLLNYNKELDLGNTLEAITNNDNIEKKIVKPLLKVKEYLKQKYEIDLIDVLIDKIDETIKLLQNKNDILRKYNDFYDVSKIINELNKNPKEETNWFYNSKYYISEISNEPLISEELWENAKEKLDFNNEI